MKRHPAVWKELGTTSEFDSDLLLEAVSPWEQKWECLGLHQVNLPNLAFPGQLYERQVYRIHANGRPIEFCAFEVSANVWRFWVPLS
ncbi:MAG: hypothetical protein O9256_01820 [Rhizobiaceae bacterium]|nr:hypothetical protein [Rhizobiaceae bacterium]